MRREGSAQIESAEKRWFGEPDESVVVLGIGNLIYSDDGIGLEALKRLGNHSQLPAGVRLVDGSLGSLDVSARIGCASRLLILDAVDVGVVPGTVVRMTGDQLSGLPGATGVHSLGIPDLLSVLRLMGRTPEEVVVLGVQPASVRLGTMLSPGVRAALDRVVAESLRQLAEWLKKPDAGGRLSSSGSCCESAGSGGPRPRHKGIRSLSVFGDKIGIIIGPWP
jgi:hydrogenase maturation protease